VSRTPTTTDPVDIAMAAVSDADGDAAARALLEKQGRLIDAQLAEAGRREKLQTLEHFRERIKAARDLALVLGAVALLIGAALFVRDAIGGGGLVVEPLRAPPDLAAQGLDGVVLATRLLDKVSAMQAQTDSARPPDSFRNNWGEELEVEIPQTGVALGEVGRWLRQRFGRETRISGEVWRTPTGLAVTTRAGAAPGRTFEGPEAELDRLLQRAAETVYAETQPYRWSVFLSRDGLQGEEARRVLLPLTQSPDPTEVAWAFHGLSNYHQGRGESATAAAMSRRSLQAVPDMTLAWNNMAQLEAAQGHDEAALRATRRVATLLPRASDVSARSRAILMPLVDGWRALQSADFPRAAAAFLEASEQPDYGDFASLAVVMRAEALGWAHDPGAARRLLDGGGFQRPESLARFAGDIGLAFSAHFAAAAAAENWPAALAAVEALEAEAAKTPAAAIGWTPTLLRPQRALALARLGRADEAVRLAAETPLDCYRCLWTRGAAAGAAEDPVQADRWFAEAVRRGPSLPFAHLEWGRARLARGDVDGAVRLFREAQKRGPRWADPLKFEGDALAGQGDHQAAVRRYAQAAERAPRWGALHLAWGRSLEALGREDEARAKYAQAGRLDLNATDRAEVARRLGSAR
jgi:tetratricopeptide (TPR) repeat protein